MASPLRRDARRYRRRILAIGAVLFGLLFVVMAPLYVDGVEVDLEQRVPDELAEAGFVGVTAEFDGQDGTLSCEAPLTDPEAARQAAYDIWGVRAIDLDRSCRVNTGAAPTATTTPSTTEAPTDASTDVVSDTTVAEAPEVTAVLPTDPTTPATPATSAPVETAFESVAAAVAGSPQLSLLTVLLHESGLDTEFADVSAAPITLFAPSDDAFESLPADVLAGLRSDPEALSELVWHHTSPGSISTADLVAGDLEMTDGTIRTVAIEPLTIDGFGFAATDIDAPNGVVHIVDGVLVPDDVDSSETPTAASVSVQLEGATVTLTGAVSTPDVRQALLDAAAAPETTVADAMTVDQATGLDTANAERLVALLAALRSNLINGAAGFDGDQLYLTGTYLTDADRDEAMAIAASVDVEPMLNAPPEASVDDAVSLEDELNQYVADNPILFEQSSSTISDSSGAILDKIGLLAQQFDSVTITVQGHTDTDGNANDNLWLSRVRARAVSDALIERGLASDVVFWEGFGGEQPVLVDGVEDKAASRRVEFSVELTS